MTDGRFFVAYTDVFNAGGDPGDIYGQFINADGTLSGAAIRIDFLIEEQDVPAVAARQGGGAVVVYTTEGPSNGANTDIYLRTVSSTGALNPTNPGGAGIEVAGNATFATTTNLRAPDVATFANGSSIIVFENDVSSSDHDIIFRILNADGATFTATTAFVDGSPRAVSLPSPPRMTSQAAWQPNMAGCFGR